MKKLSVICTFLLVFSLIASQTLAIQYCKDVLEEGNPGGWAVPPGLKTFDDEYTVSAGDTFEIDIWINDAPGGATLGGFWLDFTDSTDKIAYLGCGRYLNDGSEAGNGPWDPTSGNVVNEPDGTGTLMVTVGLLAGAGAMPDTDGDIIIAKVTFECIVAGEATIAVNSIPVFDTWAPNSIWPETAADEEAQIPANTLTFQECSVNEDCEDDLWCNGDESCVDGACVAGTEQCPDDGLWCNGDEECDETNKQCIPGEPRCQDDFLYCNGDEYCNEDEEKCEQQNIPCQEEDPCQGEYDDCTINCDELTDTCFVCNATGPSDPCCTYCSACAEAEVCTVEYTDYYVNGETGINTPERGTSAGEPWKTITYALSTIPTLMELDANNRANINVAALLANKYDTDMGGEGESFPLMMIEYISLLGDGYKDTIIDAEGTGSVIEFAQEGNIHNVTLDGFTITGGYNFRGGGITVIYADPVISNCNIIGNTAWAINGGGVYLSRSNAIISNCIIAENTAPYQRGGGISCGNLSSPEIINCTIVNNGTGCLEDEGGGGIIIGKDGSATVINTILWGNYKDCSPDPELNQILVQKDATLTID